MALYDEIQNTFDENKLLEILKIYCSNNSLYNALVRDNNFQDSTIPTYKNNFLHYIQNPFVSELYNALKKTDFDATDKNISEYIEKTKKRTDLNYEQIQNTIESVEQYWLYPLSEYKEIFNKFNSYEELLNYLEKMNFNIIAKDLEDIAFYPKNPQILNEAKENIKKKTNLTDKGVEELLLINKLKRKLRNKFWGGDGIMGFHLNKTRINPNDETNQRGDIKFYINIGTDSYQFANIFRQKCIKQNIDYSFKVVDAFRNKEYRRTDKICVWSSFEDAERIVNILKEIKREYPNLDYKKPPILCGTIDDFIGVGQDFNESFNYGMSEIITQAIEKVFGTKDKNELLKIIQTNPNKLTELKNETMKIAESQGLDPTKMCVQKNTKEMLDVFNDNKPHCIQKDNKYYINRTMYEEVVKKNIKIEGTPRVIGGKNFYEVTKEQLDQIKNNKTNTNTSTNKTNTNSIITIYNDKITNKKYIKEKDLGYKKENPKTIMNNTCYEISDEEINKLNKRIVNISIYLKQKKTLKVPIASIDNKLYIPSEYTNNDTKKIKIDGVIYNEVTKDYLAILKQQLKNKDTELILIKKNIVKKNTTSDNLIPGTNIPKPRNRGLYETDEEYEQFLKEYYDKVFNKNKELNDMFINNNTNTKEKNK